MQPAIASRGYSIIIKRFKSSNIFIQFGWFLSRNGLFPQAIRQFERAESLGAPTGLMGQFISFNLTKAGEEKPAVESFLRSFRHSTQEEFTDSNLMYFLFLLSKVHRLDYTKIVNQLEDLKNSSVSDDEREIYKRLLKIASDQIHEVYSNTSSADGFVIFIDLVNSTKYKSMYPHLWKERTIYFLKYTRYSFLFAGFDFIKFIGDEVMMFYPFRSGETKAESAKKIFKHIFGKDRWYADELNRFNPALLLETDGNLQDHLIKFKICIGEVNGATIFSPNSDKWYDLIGQDIDRTARIKEMGMANCVVVDDGFRSALGDNEGPYSQAFDGLRWEMPFKGFDEKIHFYGRLLPD